MKLQTLVAGLYWASSALATVNKTVNADGQIESVVYSNGALAKRDCTSNNCVRAYKARPLAATSFCQTFTAAAATAVAPFTQCTDLKQASSACSCYVPVGRSCLRYCPNTMSESHDHDDNFHVHKLDDNTRGSIV